MLTMPMFEISPANSNISHASLINSVKPGDKIILRFYDYGYSMASENKTSHIIWQYDYMLIVCMVS
jgi:hypothetical protein